ncbi:MAG TPA: condensation domain-containing protein, partial [Kofleriaceae bacterium]
PAEPITDPVARRLAELWATTLGADPAQLGADSDFFALGGHSLKAMLLAARVQRGFGVAVAVRSIYEQPTLGSMADRIRSATGRHHAPIAVLPPQPRYRVAPAQQRFFVLHALSPDTVAYNMPLTVELGGPLDTAKLARALAALAARHAVLRTGFALEDGVLFQRVVDAVQVPVEVVDATEDDVPRLIRGFVRPFDLARPPLMRALVMRTGPERATLTLDFHHIVLDGFSIGILLREALRLYTGEALPPLHVQYRDYVAWLDEPAQQHKRERQAALWTARFAGDIPVLNLPADRPRPPVRTMAGGAHTFTLPPGVVEPWRRLARDERASLFMVCLAAFHVFLTKLSGQDRTVVGTPVAGRSHADLEGIVGVFVNTLALGNRIDARQSFRGLLAEVRTTTLEALDHQDYPFEELVERLNAARDTTRSPLYDAFLAFHNMDISAPPGAALTVTQRDPGVPTSKFDLSLFLTESDAGLSAVFEYASDLFERGTVERFARYFTTLCRQIADDPDRPVGVLTLVDDAERARLEA